MKLLLLSYAAGVLTILSPCILPVLPFIFARSGQKFLSGTLPLLIGMALTFAAVASLAASGGGWAVHANDVGRKIALVMMAIFGLTLLIPALADRLTAPFVTFGNRVTERFGQQESILASLAIGVATGFLWAPCAGPILGVILTTAALEGAGVRSASLLLCYGAGAATSLGIIGFVGGSVLKMARKSLGVGAWIRRVLGVAVLAAAAIIGFGLDTKVSAFTSNSTQARIEQSLIAKSGMPVQKVASPIFPPAPALKGAVAWINSKPLTMEDLRGHVVLVDFWTYSCINCLRTLPYIQSWADRYGKDGLVIVGVHTPEFAFEKQIDNVQDAVKRLHLTYPIAVDSNYGIWRAYDNHYWPAHYLIDAQGRIRDQHFGEGGYAETENAIRNLLAEAGKPLASQPTEQAIVGTGAEKAADETDIASPETYVGYARAERFASPGGITQDLPHDYSCPKTLNPNHWCFGGNWIVQDEKAIPAAAGATIRFQFHARDLHMVLGGQANGQSSHIRVLIDGKLPGDSHGGDLDADGNGVVTDHRLYQLIRQQGNIEDRTIEIQFLDPGAQVFTFTFG